MQPMFKTNWKYWMCQVVGWGGWMLINFAFLYIFAYATQFADPKRGKITIAVLIIEFIWSIIATHLLRLILNKLNWIQLPISKVILIFVAGVILTCFVFYHGAKQTALLTGYSLVEYDKKKMFPYAQQMESDLGVQGTDYYLMKKLSLKDSTELKIFTKIKANTHWYRNKAGEWEYYESSGMFWWNMIFNASLIGMWLLLYMVWHYIEKNRKDQFDRLTLEKTVKELEVKTIKSHINPHFIFNSLNSIRALVDENPERARRAITELSNILRSSMQVEKMETVPLEKELDIVKDYLALEQMRFEERLKIDMDIDEDTLYLPVPPMMLQTLVENAIKHGISKQIKGGYVKVISRIRNQEHELIVENSGQMEGEVNGDGFGIKSTVDRLRFLYQGRASFEIKNINGDTVQSKITMPL